MWPWKSRAPRGTADADAAAGTSGEAEAAGKASHGEPGPGTEEEFAGRGSDGRLWPKVVVGCVALALFGWLAAGSGGGLAEVGSDRMVIQRSTEPVDESSLPAATGARDAGTEGRRSDVARVLMLGWGRLEDAPITSVHGAPGVEFGDGLAVVGASQGRLAVALADLLDLDTGPLNGRWADVHESALPARAEPLLAVVDESLLLVWGGTDGVDGGGLPRSDGALLDVGSGTWTATPPLPLEGAGARSAAWTGGALVVVGSGPGSQPMAMRWSPGDDAWERLPDPPVPAIEEVRTVAVGDTVVALGVHAGDGQFRSEVFSLGLDTASGEWREYPMVPLRRPTEAVTLSTGDRLISWGRPAVFSRDEKPDGLLLDPETGQWRQLPPPPSMTQLGTMSVASRPSELSAIWTGQLLIVSGRPELAPLVLEPDTRTWVGLAAPDAAPPGGELAWARGRLLHWGGRSAEGWSSELWIMPAARVQGGARRPPAPGAERRASEAATG